MKFVYLIVATALMCQAISAATLRRSKRSDANFLKDFEFIQNKYMEFLPTTAEILEETLAKIPQDKEYAECREDIESYLAKLEDFKASGSKCICAGHNLQEQLTIVMLDVTWTDNVKEWFQESGGDKIRTELKKLETLENELKIEKRVTTIDPIYIEQWQEIVTKSCR